MKFNKEVKKISDRWNSLVEEKNPVMVELLNEVQSSLLKNLTHVQDFDKITIDNKPGIYCFFIDTFDFKNSPEFCKSWDANYKNNKKLKGLTRPTDLRFKEPQNRGADSGKTIFYIGKRRELKSRLKQHITHTDSSTYGLKLNRKGAEEFKKQMYFSYWYLPEIDKIDIVFTDMMLTTIEHQLIDKWNPRVGNK